MRTEQRHISSYHHTDCLLFQFLLDEFLSSYREHFRLKSLCDELEQNEEPKKQRRLLKQVAASIEVLSGTMQEYMRIFSWNTNGGSLKKIMSYSTQLSTIADSQNTDAFKAHKYANKTWVYCLQCHDLLLNGKLNLKELLAVLNEIQRLLRRLANAMIASIEEYKDDENVLFYILRHKEEFDKLIGKRFVFKLFTKIFPKGISSAKRFLVRRYKKRGFDALVPIITQKIVELETV